MLKKKKRIKGRFSAWQLFSFWLLGLVSLVLIIFLVRFGLEARTFWQWSHQNNFNLVSLNRNGLVLFTSPSPQEKGVIFFFPPQVKWYSYFSHQYISLDQLIRQPEEARKIIKMNLAIPLSNFYLSQEKRKCPLLAEKCLKQNYLPHKHLFHKKWWQSIAYWQRFGGQEMAVVKVKPDKEGRINRSEWDALWQKYNDLSSSYRVALFYRFDNLPLRRYYHRLVRNLGWQVAQEKVLTAPVEAEMDYNGEEVNYCFGPAAAKLRKEMKIDLLFNCLLTEVKRADFRSDLGLIIQSLNF